MLKKKEILIKGYNGIMDLDLTNVNKQFHKNMIEQHKKDIMNYKLEQSKLKPELRYENTILVAIQKIKKENYILSKRL
jgi:hypothetical protein